MSDIDSTSPVGYSTFYMDTNFYSMIVARFLEISDVESIYRERGYIVKEVVGRGSYATVFLAKSLKYQMEFVIKRIDFITNPKLQEKATIPEINTLLHLNHPNIINMFDYWYDDEALNITFEYCPNGTIFDFIQYQGEYQDRFFLQFAYEILGALDFCHERKIAHCDIKPANILIDKYCRPKLADFGLANIFEDRKMSGMTGSLSYMAPEILNKWEFDPIKADIWALGITFYNIFFGNLPWVNVETRKDIEYSIQKGEIFFPPETPHEIKLLITRMTTHDPQNRPSATELLQLPFFASMSLPTQCNIKSSLSYDPKKIQNLSKSLSQYMGNTNTRSTVRSLNKLSLSEVHINSDDEAMPIVTMRSKINAFRVSSNQLICSNKRRSMAIHKPTFALF